MPLFQQTVIAKYLKTQDKNLLQEKWIQFQNHFHNVTIQDNIRNSKEEQYQGEFLLDLFVAILGYTKNPQPNFNLTTEYKNVKDSKKADGAIVINEKVIAVIELKGTETTDLGKIESQAFGYKNNQPDCNYIITSNFEKIRFYIDNAIEYIEFNLFKLKKTEFDVLYLILGCNNLANNLAKRIKEESLSQEDQITKSLYKDYSLFKRELFHNLVANNMQFEPIDLFKKSQKLLDRFLFLFFAEDRHLLPPNSVRLVLSDWRDLQDRDVDIPLYDRFKKYFEYLNTGYKGKRYDVYAYNGGLFKPDEILDHVTIDNDLLYKHTLKLSDYDFASEVDVNILGHIFENSLNELDEMKAQLEGQEIDKSKTKRKKDGVFYTPKYITKYIVENTIGKLCNEKKNELQLVDEDYTTDKKRQKKTVQQLNERLQTYRNWLLQITICDPACGSGAFLNQALDFLINEHAYVDELQAKLFGDAMILSDVEKSILENNLFGVDLNEESVEIAKLSLWLRTAQPNRKLNDLSGNIKCGNSLIDDPEVAGEKAFNWQEAFPKVFAKGGFDVIIGNPPYVNANDIKKNSTLSEYQFLKSKFKIAKGTVDLYLYFFEKGLEITKSNGLLAYITPNRFLSASYGKAFREILLTNYELISLIDYSDKNVFADASTYPVITFIRNQLPLKTYNLITGKFDDLTKKLISNKYPSDKLNILDDFILGFLLNDKINLTIKVFSQSEPLENCGKINATSTASEADLYSSLITDENGYKLINTGTIDPYISLWGIDFLTDKGTKYLRPYLPKTSNIISTNRHNLYSTQKIIISKIGLKCEAFFDKKSEYASINTNCIYNFSDLFLPEYITCWLNSKLFNYTFECLFDGLRMSGGYLLFSAPNLKNTRIKKISLLHQNPFVAKADQMLSLNKDLLEKSIKFQRTLQRKFEGIEVNKKLESWYELTFAEFVKELGKKKIKLSLSEESEWEDYFLQEQQKAVAIKNEIDATDKEIDRMVYELYGLTEEEIKIVEGS